MRVAAVMGIGSGPRARSITTIEEGGSQKEVRFISGVPWGSWHAKESTASDKEKDGYGRGGAEAGYLKTEKAREGVKKKEQDAE